MPSKKPQKKRHQQAQRQNPELSAGSPRPPSSLSEAQGQEQQSSVRVQQPLQALEKAESEEPGNSKPNPGCSGDSVSGQLGKLTFDPLSTRTRSKNPNPSLEGISQADWGALYTKSNREAEAARLQSIQPQLAQPTADTPESTSSSQAGDQEGGEAVKTAVQRAAEARLEEMSRNRGARAAPSGESAEEINLFQEIKQDVEKAKTLHDQQLEIIEQIDVLNRKMGKPNSKPTLAEHDQLYDLHKQVKDMSKEESDMNKATVQKLHILAAMRKHAENNAPSGKPRKRRPDTTDSAADSPSLGAASLVEKTGRSKSHTNRSTSVGSRVRDGEAAEGTKGTVAEKDGQLFVGAEVVFKHNKKQHGMEGEGIQCNIKSITGEGSKKRYEVQDPEPIENGEEGAVYKTTAASLIPIPKAGTSLLSFPAGKQVLARYPDTTTFYRAEVVGSRKDTCRLRFEGEEDDKELEVDRRFVLDIPGK